MLISKYLMMMLCCAALEGGGPDSQHDIDMVGLIDEELDDEEFLQLLREVGDSVCSNILADILISLTILRAGFIFSRRKNFIVLLPRVCLYQHQVQAFWGPVHSSLAWTPGVLTACVLPMPQSHPPGCWQAAPLTC